MTDNTTIRTGIQGTAIAIATKEINSQHEQRVIASGHREDFTITPVIDTNAYTSGDCLGPLQTIAGAARVAGLGGHIEAVAVVDKTQAQRAAIDLLFFNASVTTAANNAPFTCSDADMLKTCSTISILAADYNTAWPGTPLNSFAFKPDTKLAGNPMKLWVPYRCVGSTSLYMQAIVRGTPTYTSTSDIQIVLTCVLD